MKKLLSLGIGLLLSVVVVSSVYAKEYVSTIVVGGTSYTQTISTNDKTGKIENVIITNQTDIGLSNTFAYSFTGSVKLVPINKPITIRLPTPTPVTSVPAAIQVANQDCNPNYEGVCLINTERDILNCGDIEEKNFRVIGRDVFKLDKDKNGYACEK